MKIVRTDGIYKIYSDDLKTFDSLPVGVYNARFSKFTGFYLEEHAPICITEKIYGPHESKVEKIFRSFNIAERNLGVILSGAKGIGKSLTSKLLAEKSVANQIPVILISEYIPGIADFIDSIEQEVMVLFDEFDKTFAQHDGNDPQAELLTLFDGVSTSTKKMFIITCNNINRLNDYLVNRPGRFHYHLRYDYPSTDEIREYLEDKLKPEYYSEINKVISFSSKVNLNFDCLRAIAFELNNGDAFEVAIKDLNIMNIDNEMYNATAVFNDGTKSFIKRIELDMFSDDDDCLYIYPDNNNRTYVKITFNCSNIKYDQASYSHILKKENIREEWYYDDDEDKNKHLHIEYVQFTKAAMDNYHYSLIY